jgi:hypothetical protein
MPELAALERLPAPRRPHVWRRVRARDRHCVACGRPSPRAWTCAGCRWLDEQELQRARAWDEIDPDRNDLASSRELPWTVQGLLSMEVAAQQALSPEDLQLRLEREQEREEEAARRARDWQLESDQRRAAEAQAARRAREAATQVRPAGPTLAQKAAHTRARRAADRKREAWWAAERERAARAAREEQRTAQYHAAQQAALDETVAQMRASGSLPPPGVVQVPVHDKVLAVGQRAFWHPFGDCTCLTEAPNPICLCGTYRLTWP